MTGTAAAGARRGRALWGADATRTAAAARRRRTGAVAARVAVALAPWAVAAALILLSSRARGQPVPDEDDPGLARRRTEEAPAPPAKGGLVFKPAPPASDGAPAPPAPVPPPVAPEPVPPPILAPPPPALVPRPVAPAPPPRALAPPPAGAAPAHGPSGAGPALPETGPRAPLAPSADGVGVDALVARPPMPVRRARDEPITPRLKLTYSRFSFVRVGALDVSSSTGAAAPEAFDNVGLDVYPVSSLMRFGFGARAGWQSGTLGGGGDRLWMASMSMGAQYPGRVTPFAEVSLGAGYMRRLQLGAAVPTGYWELGVDGGIEMRVSGRSYLSIAVGYLRPVSAFVRTSTTGATELGSVYLDTWSLKVGCGI